MDHIIAVNGDNDHMDLVFVLDVREDKSRGAVSRYHLLCDLLRYLCEEAQMAESNAPGPVHKFLANDTVSRNGSFAEDAFVNNVIGGEKWLVERRTEGLLVPKESLSVPH